MAQTNNYTSKLSSITKFYRKISYRGNTYLHSFTFYRPKQTDNEKSNVRK